MLVFFFLKNFKQHIKFAYDYRFYAHFFKKNHCFIYQDEFSIFCAHSFCRLLSFTYVVVFLSAHCIKKENCAFCHGFRRAKIWIEEESKNILKFSMESFLEENLSRTHTHVLRKSDDFFLLQSLNTILLCVCVSYFFCFPFLYLNWDTPLTTFLS